MELNQEDGDADGDASVTAGGQKVGLARHQRHVEKSSKGLSRATADSTFSIDLKSTVDNEENNLHLEGQVSTSVELILSEYRTDVSCQKVCSDDCVEKTEDDLNNTEISYDGSEV